MNELQALEHAARYRELARFYGEAAKSMRNPTHEAHYTRLYKLCEAQAYTLECAVVGAPEEEGGNLYDTGNLPARVA